eukprot:symbB.v1.2.041436.t1/scaffold8201.1/size7331/1
MFPQPTAEESKSELRLSELTGCDLPERLACDGRLLADFALFLHEANRPKELLDLWALDLASAVDWSSGQAATSCISEGSRCCSDLLDCCCDLIEGLQPLWED